MQRARLPASRLLAALGSLQPGNVAGRSYGDAQRVAKDGERPFGQRLAAELHNEDDGEAQQQPSEQNGRGQLRGKQARRVAMAEVWGALLDAGDLNDTRGAQV